MKPRVAYSMQWIAACGLRACVLKPKNSETGNFENRHICKIYLHITAQVLLIKYSRVSLDTIQKDFSHFRKDMDLLYSKLAQTLIFCVQFRLFHRSRENEYFTCSVTCSMIAVKTVHSLSYALDLGFPWMYFNKLFSAESSLVKRINDSVKEKN